MDFSLIIKAIAPTLISLLSSTSETFRTDGPTTGPLVAVSNPKASKAIADLQAVLNAVLGLDPPLEVDGWLGPKTEAAIELGIEKLKALGVA